MTVERLYTPWRMKYITSKKKKDVGCVFCAALNDNPEKDRENYVVLRGKTTFSIMNIYPYNTGHLMVLPKTHVSTLIELPQETLCELMAYASYFTELLGNLMNPDGFNVGVNVGREAGAGIDSHLHLHIVPRWNGDSNFMAVIGNTRILPETLEDTYDKIVAGIRDNQPPTFR